MLDMPLKAIGFDIDGTLYPVHRAQRQSLFFFLRHNRIIMDFTRTRRRMRKEGRDDDKAELQIFAEELQRDIEDAKDIRDKIIYQGWEKCFRKVQPFKGVRNALLRLKESGLKLAALSDWPVGRKLEYFGLADLFDVILGFPETQRLKPRIEPFRLMSDQLGIAPNEILYIGDRLEYDVIGARKSGMRGALIGLAIRKHPPGVTIYDNYADLVEKILTEVHT